MLLFLFLLLCLYSQKILASLEQKNGEIKPKSRRRWGLISRSTKGSDDWADLDDLDFSPSLTRVDVKNKKRQSDDTLCRQVCRLSVPMSRLTWIYRSPVSPLPPDLNHILLMQV